MTRDQMINDLILRGWMPVVCVPQGICGVVREGAAALCANWKYDAALNMVTPSVLWCTSYHTTDWDSLQDRVGVSTIAFLHAKALAHDA